MTSTSLPAMRARPFSPSAAGELAEYIARCTGDAMSPQWALHTITKLIEGPRAVLDLWRGNRRAGVAVCLDTCETAGNAAELSLFSADESDHDVLRALLQWGHARAVEVGRARIDIPVWPGTNLKASALAAQGYRVGYVLYRLRRGTEAGPPRSPRIQLPFGWRWQQARLDHAETYHDTLRAAFSGVAGAYVAPLADFRAALPSYELPPRLLLAPEADAPVAGFVRLSRHADGTGEIASLGRHPRYRGFGLGDQLVARAVIDMQELGIGELELEVADSNTAGLALYDSFQFRKVGQTSVYQREL